MVPEHCWNTWMGQNICITLHDLLCGPRPVLLRRPRVVVVNESHGLLGPEAHESTGLAATVAQTPVLLGLDRLHEDSLGRKVKGARLLSSLVDPVADSRAVRVLIFFQVTSVVVEGVPILANAEIGLCCGDVLADKLAREAPRVVDTPPLEPDRLQALHPVDDVVLDKLLLVVDIRSDGNWGASRVVALARERRIVAHDGAVVPVVLPAKLCPGAVWRLVACATGVEHGIRDGFDACCVHILEQGLQVFPRSICGVEVVELLRQVALLGERARWRREPGHCQAHIRQLRHMTANLVVPVAGAAVVLSRVPIERLEQDIVSPLGHC
mmetsp:Transcript_835/g.2697  ORF Transcript_835/g.2697 Transcript_835/m.2697 type:complete len:325 (+) Transcript_835:605-1579(+)